MRKLTNKQNEIVKINTYMYISDSLIQQRSALIKKYFGTNHTHLTQNNFKYTFDVSTQFNRNKIYNIFFTRGTWATSLTWNNSSL